MATVIFPYQRANAIFSRMAVADDIFMVINFHEIAVRESIYSDDWMVL